MRGPPFLRGLRERPCPDGISWRSCDGAFPPRTLYPEGRLTSADRQRVLFDWNRTASPLPGGCLHHLAEAAARADPGAPAIIFRGKSVTYDDLMRRAKCLASVLRRHSVGDGAIVALYLPRSPEHVSAQLAVLKRGAAWLPID